MTTTRNILLSSVLFTSVAYAQPADSLTRSEVAPISNALEVAIGGGYMQGVGDIGDGMPGVDDVSRSGGGAQLDVGVRVTPNLTLGAYSTLAGYNTGDSVAASTDLVIGATVGAKADWHFRPTTAVDPWLSVGAGWRGLWYGNDAATEQRLQGIDIARVQAGVDYRLTPSFALSPFIGASATMFLAKGDAMTDGYDEIDGKSVNYSFTGGLLGRFDMFGTRGR